MSDFLVAKVDEALEVMEWVVTLSEDPGECSEEVHTRILTAQHALLKVKQALRSEENRRPKGKHK